MGNEENMGNKIEEFNEFLLKQAAITFSMEGVSRDLKSFIQKKIAHNRINLEHVASLIGSLAHSPSRELRDGSLKKGSTLATLLEHVAKEIRFTDTVLNMLIQNILNKESLLAADKEKTQEFKKGHL